MKNLKTFAELNEAKQSMTKDAFNKRVKELAIEIQKTYKEHGESATMTVCKKEAENTLKDEVVIESKKDEEAKHTEIWHKLDKKGDKVYDIAKRLKMLPDGFDKNMWKVRGGLLLSHVASEIMKDKELGKMFGINEATSSFEETLIRDIKKHIDVDVVHDEEEQFQYTLKNKGGWELFLQITGDKVNALVQGFKGDIHLGEVSNKAEDIVVLLNSISDKQGPQMKRLIKKLRKNDFD